MRKVDQERINRFSRIHTKHKALENELKTKQVSQFQSRSSTHGTDENVLQKDKEDLEEISTELELADEDDKVP